MPPAKGKGNGKRGKRTTGTSHRIPSTHKRQRFAEEYLVDMNAGKAAERAGFAPKSAYSMGSRLLKEPKVQAMIADLRASLSEKTGVTVERVVAELEKLAFASMGNYMQPAANGDPRLSFENLTPEQMAALSEVTVESFINGDGDDAGGVKRVKFRLWDKRAALVDLGKHLGMFVERIGDKDGNPLRIILTSERE